MHLPMYLQLLALFKISKLQILASYYLERYYGKIVKFIDTVVFLLLKHRRHTTVKHELLQ